MPIAKHQCIFAQHILKLGGRVGLLFEFYFASDFARLWVGLSDVVGIE